MELNSEAKITVDDVQGLKCLILDDAFLNPDELRQYSVDCFHPEKVTRNRLGYEIHPRDIDQKIPNFREHLAQIVHTHIGTNICGFFGIDVSQVSLRAYKGPYFACVGVDKLPANAPHVDAGHISTFCYLSLPEPTSLCYQGHGVGVYRLGYGAEVVGVSAHRGPPQKPSM